MTFKQSIQLAGLVTSLSLTACSEQSGSAIEESADASACRTGAEYMIDVARQAVADTSSRPERRESRRQLMEDWVARLAAGEDPCAVYADINLASTTF